MIPRTTPKAAATIGPTKAPPPTAAPNASTGEKQNAENDGGGDPLEEDAPGIFGFLNGFPNKPEGERAADEEGEQADQDLEPFLHLLFPRHAFGVTGAA